MPHELVDLRSSMLITPKGYTVSNEGFFSSIKDAIVKFFTKLIGSGESGSGSTNTGSLVIKKISSSTDELIDRFFKLKKEAVNVVARRFKTTDDDGKEVDSWEEGLAAFWNNQATHADDREGIRERTIEKTKTDNPDIVRCFYLRGNGGREREIYSHVHARQYLENEILEIIRSCKSAKIFELDICHLVRYVDKTYTEIIEKMVEDITVDGRVTTERRRKYASMIISNLFPNNSGKELTGYIHDSAVKDSDNVDEGIPSGVYFGFIMFSDALEIMTACKAINKKGISLIKDTITDANIGKAFDKFAGQVASDVTDVISSSKFKEIDDSLRKSLPDRICKELTLVFTDVYRLLVKYVISAYKVTNYFAKSVMACCPATEISEESYTSLRRLPIRQSVSLYPTVFTTPEGYTMSNENFIKDIIDAIIKFFSKLFGGGDSSGGSGSSTTATNVIKKTLTTTQEMVDEFYKFLKTEKPADQWTAHLGARGLHGTKTSELKVRSCFYERDGARETDINILPDGNNRNLDAYVENTDNFVKHIKNSKVFESDMVYLISSLRDDFDKAILELVKLESSDEPNKESERKEIIIEYTGEFISRICNETVTDHGLIGYCLDSNIEDRKDNIEAGLPESITMGMYIDLEQAREIMTTVRSICKAGLELTHKSASESKIETNLEKAGEIIGATIAGGITAHGLNLSDNQRDSLVAHVHKTIMTVLMNVSRILVTYVLNIAALCHYLAKAVMSFCPGVTFSKESYADIHKPMKYLTTPDTVYKESVSLLPDYRIFIIN